MTAHLTGAGGAGAGGAGADSAPAHAEIARIARLAMPEGLQNPDWWAQGAAIASLQKHFAALPGATQAKLVISGPGWFGVQASRHTRAEADRFGVITTVGFILMLLLMILMKS